MVNIIFKFSLQECVGRDSPKWQVMMGSHSDWPFPPAIERHYPNPCIQSTHSGSTIIVKAKTDRDLVILHNKNQIGGFINYLTTLRAKKFDNGNAQEHFPEKQKI